MDRLESFEKMLADLIRQAEQEQAEMERLKMAGKEKTATYRLNCYPSSGQLKKVKLFSPDSRKGVWFFHAANRYFVYFSIGVRTPRLR